MGHIKKTLSDYLQENTLRLHMPGHKGKLNALDITELPQTDDLNSPLGAYSKAIDFLTQTYKSKKSFYITSGATLGIQAAVLYAKKMGYKIVASRNSHMSVINACFVFDVDCAILTTVFDEDAQTFKSSADVVLSYIEKSDEKCAVFITSPDYFGRCEDIKMISDVVDANDGLLLCDAAHGSHFIFSAMLPEDLHQYADIWINGAHKTLGAYTQGAFVHCNNKIDIDAFESVFYSLNTTSPSPIIASSLEEALLDSKGDNWSVTARSCAQLESKINELEYIKCASGTWANNAGYHDKDVTRIVIDSKNAGGGYYIYDKLYKDFNIQLEMADFRYAVAIITMYDDEDCYSLLYEALKALDEKKDSYDMPDLPEAEGAILPMQEAWMGKTKAVELEQAEGKIAACVLGVYPPGTALILPGEKITSDHVEFFKKVLGLGGHILGERNNKILISDII